MRDKADIDKSAHQWQPGGYERPRFGIQDCPHELSRGGRFVLGILRQKVFASKATGQAMSTVTPHAHVCQALNMYTIFTDRHKSYVAR